ncbi:MAG: hypothetical protein ABSH52_04000 [Terriglobia bacterium]
MSSATQGTAGKNREQQPKSVDDFTVSQANTIYGKIHYFEMTPIVPSHVSTN